MACQSSEDVLEENALIMMR